MDPEPAEKGWIDAHCHLADPRFDSDRAAALERSRSAGVGAWIQGGVGPEDWKRQDELAAEIGPGLVRCFGVHPWWIAEHAAAAVENALGELAGRLSGAAAVGETGLDKRGRGRWGACAGLQKEAFRRQVGLAREAGKPLVLHVVKAHAEALEILGSLGPFPAGGLVHYFSGEASEAKAYAALGFLLSFGASVGRVIKGLRRDQFTLETDAPNIQRPLVRDVPDLRTFDVRDAPDQALERGTRNEPARLLEIAAAAAAFREESPEILLNHSRDNLKKLFKLP